MARFENGMSSIGFIMAAFGFIFMPIMVLVQEIAITFLKSAYVHVYFRLTRSFVSPVLEEAKA